MPDLPGKYARIRIRRGSTVRPRAPPVAPSNAVSHQGVSAAVSRLRHSAHEAGFRLFTLSKEGLLPCLGAPYLTKVNIKAKRELKAALAGKQKGGRFFSNAA